MPCFLLFLTHSLESLPCNDAANGDTAALAGPHAGRACRQRVHAAWLAFGSSEQATRSAYARTHANHVAKYEIGLRMLTSSVCYLLVPLLGPWLQTQLAIALFVGVISFLSFCFLRNRSKVLYAPRTLLKGRLSAMS